MIRKSFLALFIILLINTFAWSATYYVATNGNDNNPGTESQPWRHIQKAADTMVAGDMVYVKAGTYKEQVTPQNSGNSTGYITYSAYPGNTVTIDGSGLTLAGWTGLIDLKYVSYIKITGFRIMNAGPNNDNAGILSDTSSYLVIENNYIYNTVSSCIGIWVSDHVYIRGNEAQLCCNGGMEECISIAGTSYFEVSNNHLHDTGTTPAGGEGLCLKDGSNNGVAFGNHIHNVVKVGFYFDAWDKHTYNIQAYRNNIHDNLEGMSIASEMGGLLENISVFNNIIYHNVYRGLTIGGWGGEVPSHPINNVKIINNTMYGNGATWGGGIAVDNQWAQNIDIRNNITSQNTSFTIVVSVTIPNLTIDYNLIDGFRGDTGETRGTNYIEGDPLFSNATGHDFHLLTGSPVIDQGSSLNAPSSDYDQKPRPMGSGYEMGAFEYVVPTPAISLDAEITSFGNPIVNSPVSRSVTVRNIGTAVLNISSVSNPSSPFSITANGCAGQSLPAGGSCVIDLQFLPTSAGFFQGSFTVTTNDPVKGTATAGLHGSGVLVSLLPQYLAYENDATGVREEGETAVITPYWYNPSSAVNNVTGSVTADSTLLALDTSASYGNIPSGSIVTCTSTGNCYGGTAVGPRPSTHWDVTLTEVLSTYHHKDWTVHIGSSFKDVALSNIFYKYIETLLHSGVTGGCASSTYCPANNVARDQMAKFICASIEKKSPGRCTIGTCAGSFTDVTSSNIFCPYIEALYNGGIVSGCQSSPLQYCPSSFTERQSMAKFICLGMEKAEPASCTTSTCAGTFGDVPSSNVFCPYIEALYNQSVISGCQSSPLMYCPNMNVTREQMSKFLVNSFGFQI